MFGVLGSAGRRKFVSGGAYTGSTTTEVSIAAPDLTGARRDRYDIKSDGGDLATKIAEAEAALPAEGGTIKLSVDQFTSDTRIVVNKASVIQGEGAGAGYDADRIGTIISPSATAAAALTNDAFLVVDTAGHTKPLGHVLLRNFALDGRDLGSGVNGVRFQSFKGGADHLHVRRFTGRGIVNQGYDDVNVAIHDDGTPADPTDWATYDNKFRFCETYQNGEEGFVSHVQGEDIHLVSCVSHGNGGHGFYLKGASSQAVLLHAYANRGNGIRVEGSRTKLHGCKVETNNEGLILDGAITSVQVLGGNFWGNGRAADGSALADAANTNRNIAVLSSAGATSRHQFKGINCQSVLQTFKAQYGLYLGGQATQIQGDGMLGSGYVNGGKGLFVAAAASDIDVWFTDYRTRNRGVYNAQPGAVSSLTIAHGLSDVTNAVVNITPGNANARGVSFHASIDATNITLTFGSALTAATTYSWYWSAEANFYP